MLVEKSQIYYSLLGLGVAALLYLISKNKDKIHFPHKSGATPFLNLYTTDFTALALQGRTDPVVGRDEEIRKLTQVLARRSKNNAILVGPPGVGKTAIVEGLATRIAKREVPEELHNKRVLALDVATLMSGTKYRGEFEERAKKIVREIESSGRTIILFVDEVHAVVQSQGSEGSINLSDILKPALARGDLQMIGATTTLEYEKYIKTDASLERRFQPIEVREPTAAETIIILQGIKDKYREFHKVEFTDAALVAAVELSAKFIKDRKLPDKAIDALDEAAAMVKVGDVHPATQAILYQAAVAKNPKVVELWKEIQSLDKKGETAKREKLEAELADIGVLVVDSDDIKKIVHEWTKT